MESRANGGASELEYFVEQTLYNSNLNTVEWFIEKYNLRGKSRKREKVIKRAILMSEMRKKTFLSLTSIGGFFDRDHTTVIHSLKSTRLWNETKDFYYLQNFEVVQDDLKRIIFN